MKKQQQLSADMYLLVVASPPDGATAVDLAIPSHRQVVDSVEGQEDQSLMVGYLYGDRRLAGPLKPDFAQQEFRTNQDLFASIATVVTVAEILKNNGLTVEKKIRTSTVEINDESRGCLFQKAKIEIELGKSDKFDELMAASEEDTEAEDGEEQA
ncbi:uncharacterized protein LOC100841722 [Brachypodium distachyon]|uniref:uncharacterized protein LOC100841722 n=1 Tax=Brachypodium distachyon TaxID=15368 RepID=UPI000D0E2A20|nr:uncharacterized protein LOC100841722 [Brachypodium distachyon]|eukprot:XP_024313989.1 uncharacterized protein LOC100841722 [Brachypodium distachyon]